MPVVCSVGREKMSNLREHGKLIRQFLKVIRELETLELIDSMEDKTMGQIREELTHRSTPGTGYKQLHPRHGSRWSEEEKQHLIALTSAGMIDIEQFANEFQRRPESVIKYMKKIGLLPEGYKEL